LLTAETVFDKITCTSVGSSWPVSPLPSVSSLKKDSCIINLKVMNELNIKKFFKEKDMNRPYYISHWCDFRKKFCN